MCFVGTCACLHCQGVQLENRFVDICICPISIDSSRYAAACLEPAVQHNIQQLRAELQGKTVLLGVDQLDEIKGLAIKLLAFEEFLSSQPRLRDQVVLVQVTTPSSMGKGSVAAADLERSINELVGRVNSTSDSHVHTSPAVNNHGHMPPASP